MQNQLRPQNQGLPGAGMQVQQQFPLSPGLMSVFAQKMGMRGNPSGAGTPNPYQAPTSPTLDEQTAQGPPEGYGNFERSGSPGLPQRAYYQEQGAQGPQMQQPPQQGGQAAPATNPKLAWLANRTPNTLGNRFLRSWPGPSSQPQTQFPGGAPGGGI